MALAACEGTSDLFLVDGSQDFCNSLRPPAIEARTSTVPVQLRPLDQLLSEQAISRLDFLKLDVEGGELDALRGATELLSSFRPVALIEVQDVRTRPWGYAAREIIDFMQQRGYQWYRPTSDGSLTPLDTSARDYDGNFVACPRERDVTLA